MLVPAPVLAAEDYLSGLCEEDAFVDYPSASDEDSLSDVMALGYDGEQVTSSIVEAIYEKFLAAYNSCSAKFELDDTVVTVQDVRDAFDLVVANPDYYWAAPRYTISYRDSNGNMKADPEEPAAAVTLRYVVDIEQVPDAKSETESALAEGLSWVNLDTMSEFQVAQALHDYLLSKCEYDYSSVTPDASYTPFGSLAKGTAVCQGYSLGYKLLLKRAGIEALYVASKDMNHSWDLVNIDGSWYHVDATWDDTSNDPHAFFLRSDSSFRQTLLPGHFGWVTAFETPSEDYPNRDYGKYDGPYSPSSKPDPAPEPDSPAVSMYRLYNKYTGEHFYTGSESERDGLVAAGWTYEGVGWTAPETSGAPVYRLYNPYAPGGDHHYTMSASERDSLVEAGWRYEGVGWFSDDSRGVALYRQYNPYAATGSHNYTASKAENDSLVTAGWRAEGVAWYGVKR